MLLDGSVCNRSERGEVVNGELALPFDRNDRVGFSDG
jgi:hypothetical protein